MTQYERIKDAIDRAAGKTMTRTEIKRTIFDGYLRNWNDSKTNISKERFVGVAAALFGVLGYDPKKAHLIAEKLLLTHPHPPKRGKLFLTKNK